MQRHAWWWVLAGVLVGGAVVLLWYRGDCAPSVVLDAGRSVQVYPVPLDRGEHIRDALRTVLLANQERGEALGQASLPSPGRLVVAAPAAMQASIRAAVEQLSEGAAAMSPLPERAAAVDLWIVGLHETPGEDDPALAPAADALAAARASFGSGRFVLLDRGMAVGSTERGELSLQTGSMFARVQLDALDPTTVRARLELQLSEAAAPGIAASRDEFVSTLPLRNGQWQVIGLLSARQEGAPDRLLLMRQAPAP